MIRFFLVIVMALVACQQPKSDTQAIVESVNAYIRSDLATMKSEVQVEKIDSGYARVRVVPPAGTTDLATAFLRQENGGWRVLSLGTAFDDNDLRALGVPESIWPGR